MAIRNFPTKNGRQKLPEKDDETTALVAQSVERSTCDWEVAGSNPGSEDPCGTISKVTAACAIPVFLTRHKT